MSPKVCFALLVSSQLEKLGLRLGLELDNIIKRKIFRSSFYSILSSGRVVVPNLQTIVSLRSVSRQISVHTTLNLYVTPNLAEKFTQLSFPISYKFVVDFQSSRLRWQRRPVITRHNPRSSKNF